MSLPTAKIPEFIDAAIAAGGSFNHPNLSHFEPFTLDFASVVDQDLCPFSEEYYRQQIALYEEISGRPLNQMEGELHPGDESPHLNHPNPAGSWEPDTVGEVVRSLAAMVALSALPADARILDLGAGSGLSSEVFAFAGCRVRALDIDPGLGEFARQRAQRKSYPIERSIMNFDDVAKLDDGPYQAAYFFQSFHHCLKPWELIAALADKLDDTGVIGFAGEPINDLWWKDWGLRLDMESVFVARQHGWFESGWSQNFIRRCFERNGYTLLLLSGGLMGGEIGIATRSAEQLAAVRYRAARLNLAEVRDDEALPNRFATGIGARSKLSGRPAFRQEGDAGTLLFGPYIRLNPGAYDVSMIVHRDDVSGPGHITIDAVADQGTTKIWEEDLSFETGEADKLLHRTIESDRMLKNVEVRVAVHNQAGWAVSIPDISRR